MTITLKRQNLLFVLSAPSGAGKTTICRMLLDADPALTYSISTTTRPPRPGEKENHAYDFVTREQFEALREKGVFLESATVHDHLYGTRRDLIEQTLAGGRDVLLDIDTQGAFLVREAMDKAILVFILPPSMAELERRLRERETDDEAVIARRLENAKGEIRQAPKFDYQVVNDRLDEATATVRAIIDAERRRAGNQEIIFEGEEDLGVKEE